MSGNEIQRTEEVFMEIFVGNNEILRGQTLSIAGLLSTSIFLIWPGAKASMMKVSLIN